MQPGKHPILIVEDDQAIRDSLEQLLVAEGFPVLLAEHGLQALDYLKAMDTPPALILLDLSMPIIDGGTFLEEFGKQQPKCRDVPILIMTAACAQALPPQIQHYKTLRKPFDVDALMSAIEAL
jgi:CheY-like chemotaxis protein